MNGYYDNLIDIETGDEKTHLLNKDEVDQLKLILKGIKFLNNKSNQYQEIQDILTQAIHKTLKGFELDQFEDYKYNQVEKRILLLLAITYAELGEYQFSNRLLIFLLNIGAENQFITKIDLCMSIKTIFKISSNYHEVDLFEKALEYATKGIELCLKNKTMYLLKGFLSIRDISKRNFELSDVDYDFIKSIELLNVIDRKTLKKTDKEKATEMDAYINNPI